MKNIIIDTDMGVDDIIAICLLLNNPTVKIKAINTVRGVVDLNAGTKNLARILTWLGKTSMPIYKGFNPNKQKVDFPKIDRVRAQNLTFLKDLSISKGPSKKFRIEKLTTNISRRTSLLCLGSLTNIAKIIKKSIQNIQETFIMGGAVFSPGNVSPDWLTEYNITLDPRAAEFVFSSGLPITLISTDATKQVPAKDKQFLGQILATKPKTNIGKIIKAIIINNHRDFLYFYDPLAAAILIDSKIILSQKKINVTVTRNGQTVGKFSKNGTVNLVTKIDKERFYQFLIASIK